jgi:hypothetical protein
MIEKVFELICDNPNCGNAMNHIYANGFEQAGEIASDYGHIIKGKKCYCDQECYDTRAEIKKCI